MLSSSSCSSSYKISTSSSASGTCWSWPALHFGHRCQSNAGLGERPLGKCFRYYIYIYIYLSIHPSIHLSVRVLCPYDLSETMVLEVSLDVGMAGPGPSIGKVAAVSVGDPVGASFLMNLVGALPLFKMLCSWHGSSKVLVTTTICDHDRFFCDKCFCQP